MNLTILVDVAIGLCVVYLAVSLFVTILNEYIAHLLQLRSKQLAQDLRKLITDPSVVQKLMTSPALKPFFARSGGCPSYVDPDVLARQLVGGLGPIIPGPAALQSLAVSVGEIQDAALRAQLQALLNAGEATVDSFVRRVSDWVDSSLTMMGEVYKKDLTRLSLLVGLLVAGLLNVDTVRIVSHLYHDRDARTALADYGRDFASSVTPETLSECSKLTPAALAKDASCVEVSTLIEAVQLRNDTLGELPLGWDKACPTSRWAVFRMLGGWLLTAFATSLGAPFWFDLLGKLVNIRHGMRRPEPEPKPTTT